MALALILALTLPLILALPLPLTLTLSLTLALILVLALIAWIVNDVIECDVVLIVAKQLNAKLLSTVVLVGHFNVLG
ncbi:hypothetical protein D3Y55_31365 [Mesorhizobium sp. DCY119]|nr:hypothetical protein D3Y55_31365 [Mesorhizobium sp. DCY119]